MTSHFSHPHGVLPEGNILFQSSSSKPQVNVRHQGLGQFVSKLTDQLLAESILPYFDGISLGKLSFLSRVFYIFAQNDSLWRDLVLLKTKGRNIHFHKSWKDTFAMIMLNGQIPPETNPIRVSSFYSQYLFHQWLCSNYEFERIAPGFYKHEDIPRVDGRKLSIREFVENYEIPNTPVIITNAVTHWKAFDRWNEDYFIRQAGDKQFRSTSASAVMPAFWTMKEYFNYAKQVKEESPLYLFERSFASIGQLKEDYSVPCYFNPESYEKEGLLKEVGYDTDLFRLFGDNIRPDYKWLVIGPKKSGSIFHIDPNQTNAWNVLIEGRKKWIFYPPNVHPPAVQSSADGGDVVVPISTAEWLINFWSFHCESRYHKDPLKRPLEAILQPGEIMFVPNGWWHMVINLDFTIALTHNYVSTSNLSNCLTFLKYKKDQITGIRDRSMEGTISPEILYDEFLKKLEFHLSKPFYEKYLKQMENKKAIVVTTNGSMGAMLNSEGKQNKRKKHSHSSAYDREEDDHDDRKDHEEEDDDEEEKKKRQKMEKKNLCHELVQILDGAVQQKNGAVSSSSALASTFSFSFSAGESPVSPSSLPTDNNSSSHLHNNSNDNNNAAGSLFRFDFQVESN
jgi:hypothetical protein